MIDLHEWSLPSDYTGVAASEHRLYLKPESNCRCFWGRLRFCRVLSTSVRVKFLWSSCVLRPDWPTVAWSPCDRASHVMRWAPVQWCDRERLQTLLKEDEMNGENTVRRKYIILEPTAQERLGCCYSMSPSPTSSKAEHVFLASTRSEAHICTTYLHV